MTKLDDLFRHPSVEFHEVTLVAGTAIIKAGFRRVRACLITQKGAVALTESFSWDWTKPDLTIDSDNVTSTATVTVMVAGTV